MTYEVYKRDSNGDVIIPGNPGGTKSLQAFLNGLEKQHKPIFLNEKEVVIQK